MADAVIPDEWVDEIKWALVRIGDNYARETSGKGSRFEGQMLEEAQARFVIREVAARVRADTANQIADRIARRSRIAWDTDEDHGYCSGLDDAARVAREFGGSS